MTAVKHEPLVELGSRTMSLRHDTVNLEEVKALRIKLEHSRQTLFLAARGGGWCQLGLQPTGPKCITPGSQRRQSAMVMVYCVSQGRGTIFPHVPTQSTEITYMQWISFRGEKKL